LLRGVVLLRPERMMNQRKRRDAARRTRAARPRGASGITISGDVWVFGV
jgi:hypothetical protein